MRFANEAVNRWAHYDNTYWRELFTNYTVDTTDDTTTYDVPDDFQEAGGWITIGTTYTQLIDPQEVQFRSPSGTYAYFTGDFAGGVTLNLSRPTAAGSTLSYVYYRQPTLFELGDDTTDMSNPYFIVHRMLAQRLRPEQNYSNYQIALRDSEDMLKNMKLANESGTWSNPWTLPDRSGTVFGYDRGSRWTW